MKKSRRYELEGVVLDIPLYYDETTHMYYEDYPDLIKKPAWTEAGYRVMFVGEDACRYAESKNERRCVDCSGCRHYRRTDEHMLIGVCGHEKNRKKNAITHTEERQ